MDTAGKVFIRLNHRDKHPGLLKWMIPWNKISAPKMVFPLPGASMTSVARSIGNPPKGISYRYLTLFVLLILVRTP
jgi:hypothetical protein